MNNTTTKHLNQSKMKHELIKNVVEFILQVIGCAIMWYAINYKRETRIKTCSTLWLAIFGMMVIAVTLIKINL